MKTGFSGDRLRDPRIAAANDILRSCVHCGFCAPACPTYHLTGDERDSPRGRIWLMRDLLEGTGTPAADIVHHLDRCLECVACMPACPSGVDYRGLVSIAREEIEHRATRPLPIRLFRSLLARILTDRGRARLALRLARRFAPLAGMLPARWAAPLRLAGRVPPSPTIRLAAVNPAAGAARARVAVLEGCVQAALAPGINAALIRVLNRHGIEVVVLRNAACCGALDRHLGRGEAARAKARAIIAAVEGAQADAVLQTSSGCGTMMKDYAAVLADDPAFADRAAAVSLLTRDAAEYLAALGLDAHPSVEGLAVAWFAPCSAANAQGVRNEPVDLLRRAGFQVMEPADGGRCCGSAGVYNMLEPEAAEQLATLKAAALGALGADVIASGNIGCMAQLAGRGMPPVVHLVELLDWATGGPRPEVLVPDGARGGRR